jgi:hypothetical protein
MYSVGPLLEPMDVLLELLKMQAEKHLPLITGKLYMYFTSFLAGTYFWSICLKIVL